MLTSSHVLSSVYSVRFALAERAGLPDNCNFTGTVFLPHGVFSGRVLDLPTIDPSIAKAPFITGIVCFCVDIQRELFVDTGYYVNVLITFDGDGRPVGSHALPTIYRRMPAEELAKVEHLAHEIVTIMQIMELAEPKS